MQVVISDFLNFVCGSISSNRSVIFYLMFLMDIGRRKKKSDKVAYLTSSDLFNIVIFPCTISVLHNLNLSTSLLNCSLAPPCSEGCNYMYVLLSFEYPGSQDKIWKDRNPIRKPVNRFSPVFVYIS